MAGPLSNVRVLDLSRIMAAPWASQILADLGADVIKIERPGVGDDTRSWGPPFLNDSSGKATKEAGYYLSVNRGKRSITLELDKPEGQDIVRALVARSDIVLENFKVGTLKRFGLDYESLSHINPKIIYCSVTGFGQTGPKRDAAAYDFMIQAMGGLMSVTGERDGMPGGGPQKVGVPIVDLMTGMYTAVGVLAALARRAETGRGEYIDVAMLDVQVAFLANQAMNWLVSEAAPKRGGNRHPNIQPQDVFRCADGFVALAVGNDGQFGQLSKVLGHPEWIDDERFATNPARVRNHAILDPLLRAEFEARSRQSLVAALDVAGVPCSAINTIPEVFSEPQVRHRRMLRKLPHPTAGEVPQVVSPLNFTNEPLAFERPPPLLGQHTQEILRELDCRRLTETGEPLAARLHFPSVEEMTPEQRSVHDEVVSGVRGRVIGPLRAVIHSPDLARRWSRLGEFLRFSTCLPKKLNELAIIVTGRRWNSQLEFLIHSEAAIAAGLDPACVEAIRTGECPSFSEEAELEVYEFARMLQTTGQVEASVHAAVTKRWGERGVVELTGVIGYYTMVSMTLNAHEIPIPADAKAPLSAETIRGLTPLPPGRIGDTKEQTA